MTGLFDAKSSETAIFFSRYVYIFLFRLSKPGLFSSGSLRFIPAPSTPSYEYPPPHLLPLPPVPPRPIVHALPPSPPSVPLHRIPPSPPPCARFVSPSSTFRAVRPLPHFVFHGSPASSSSSSSSNSFNSLKYRDMGLNTTVTRSNIHDALNPQFT